MEPMQGEQVWLKDSKYILHEILDWRAWKGRAGQHSQSGMNQAKAGQIGYAS